MAVSLKTIADELHVSVSLVSKVLSGHMGTSGASEQVAKAIHDKARELGYQRNRAATALVTGRTGVIGVFIHRIGTDGSGIVERLVRGISASATRAGQRLWLSFFHTDKDFLRAMPFMHSGEIDGLIVAGAVHTQLIEHMVALKNNGIPVVTIYDHPHHKNLINIGADQAELMIMATNHILDRGSKKPAHIIASTQRADGFKSALKNRGLSFDPARTYTQLELGFEYAVGVKAVNHWLANNVQFDAIVAQSDQQALGALHTLMSRGISVPQQVRLIGVDDSPACPTAYVPLSSVSEHYGKRGVESVKLLMNALNGDKPRSIVVAPTLHPRQSSD